jgi:hypothetical protein
MMMMLMMMMMMMMMMTDDHDDNVSSLNYSGLKMEAVGFPEKIVSVKLDCITSQKTVIFIMPIAICCNYYNLAEINLKYAIEYVTC